MHLTALRELSITGLQEKYKLSLDACEVLTEAVKRHARTLEALDMSCDDLGPVGIKYVSMALEQATALKVGR